MSKNATRALAAGVTAVLVLAAVWLVSSALQRPAGLEVQMEATAVPAPDGASQIEVLAGKDGLRPNVVYGAAGPPLRLLVRRAPGGGGPDRLAVPDLGVSADLSAEGETTVSIPTTPRGAFRLIDRGGATVGMLHFQ